jgi:hypothetical protein
MVPDAPSAYDRVIATTILLGLCGAVALAAATGYYFSLADAEDS